MPRANRFFLPNHVWHITHRCHKREFLLKFSRDRKNYLRWLFEAKKRFGLKILNYCITSNHIHLLLKDSAKSDIPSGIQLVAGRSAQEYNQRKKRKGAFWEDRYHATAIDSGEYLFRCMLYISLNMVRAGKVKHPGEWQEDGFNELICQKERYQLIDHEALVESLNLKSINEFKVNFEEAINEQVRQNSHFYNKSWANSIAVGCKSFIENFKNSLGTSASKRIIAKNNNAFILAEDSSSYSCDLTPKIETLSGNNSLFWQ